MDASTTESLLPRTTENTSEERKPGRKSVRIDETVDIITANSPCVLESTPLNTRETVPLGAAPQPEKRSQEHDYQANHNHHNNTNLQYHHHHQHQHNHLYQQQQEEQNNNNNTYQQQKCDNQQQLHHNNNNNNNYDQQQQQHLPPSSPPPPPPPAPPSKGKELRVTFSDSPLCDSRYGLQPCKLSKSASSNCDMDINNVNMAFLRRPIKRSQRIRPKNISFNLDDDKAIITQNGENSYNDDDDAFNEDGDDEKDALDTSAPIAPTQQVESPNLQTRLESRDNPFVPGGELAIDTDDILKRATIVRDKFILDEQDKLKAENEAAALQDKTDGPSMKDVGKSPDSKGSGKDLPKENGKVDEDKAEEQGTRPSSGGQTGDDGAKEKKKQKKKCCTIM